MRWLLFLWIPLFAHIDLEEHIQDFVLETKKIEIPSFPDAFNPCITRFEGKLLLSFRNLPNLSMKFNSDIYLTFLDENFNPIGSPQRLHLRTQHPTIPCRAEDARLLYIADRFYIVYSDNIDPKITRGGFRMFIAELHHDGHTFTAGPPEKLSEFEGHNPGRREKNWTPFDYKNELLLAYSQQPHLIFRPIFGTEECETVTSSTSEIHWNWGELRGGTPALLVDGEYLTFFHSQIEMASHHSEGKTMFHYFMGAYTFSPHYPFAITRISPEPIVGPNFYHGKVHKPYWAPLRVVFPCGFIYDDHHLYISYGRQDHECWIVKLDKQKLLDSLRRIPHFQLS